ncbi:MAG: hypothetical protein U1E23_16025 [Reyranellaceae bacterium]
MTRLPGRSLLLVLVALLGGQGGARAGDESYMRRFLTDWTGGGEVKLSLDGSPWRVRCHLAPAGDETSVTLSGTCRLRFLFFLSKSIVAKLRYEASSDSYSGTYVVDDGPPALLSGKRLDDVLTLNVRWPFPVNDHLDALIRIVNDAQVFTLTTIDPIGLDGKPIVTSDLRFTPR